MEFVKNTLEAREFSKFEFTKNLSDAIELIALAGDKMGFTRAELAMLDVNDIFSNMADNRIELANAWKDMISAKIDERKENNKIVLPPVIFSEKDFDVVKYYKPRPNFITQKKISSSIVNLTYKKRIGRPSQRLPIRY